MALAIAMAKGLAARFIGARSVAVWALPPRTIIARTFGMGAIITGTVITRALAARTILEAALFARLAVEWLVKAWTLFTAGIGYWAHIGWTLSGFSRAGTKAVFLALLRAAFVEDRACREIASARTTVQSSVMRSSRPKKSPSISQRPTQLPHEMSPRLW